MSFSTLNEISNPGLKVIEVQCNDAVCMLCKRSEINEIDYGPLYGYQDMHAHYFCLLFSAALSQNGNDCDGIMGFLIDDIWKEIKRSKQLRCSFCNKSGASIGCCIGKCKKVFHFPCGLSNGVVSQFFGNYESYCSAHKKSQDIDFFDKEKQCPICINPFIKEDNPVLGSCCKSAVFHKRCLQKMALNSGYFFKCPICNTTQAFIEEMRGLGIFIPQQDASWECEPNAYEELLFEYSKCDAAHCDCPYGRNYSTKTGSWLIFRCRDCGSSAVHKKCGKLKSKEYWNCLFCSSVEKKVQSMKPTTQKAFAPSVIANNSTKSGDIALAGPSHSLQSSSSNDPSFNVSDLTISPVIFPFFPYQRSALRKFNYNQCVPDWRNYILKVELVNWLDNALKYEVHSAKSRVNIDGLGIFDNPKGNLTSDPFKPSQTINTVLPTRTVTETNIQPEVSSNCVSQSEESRTNLIVKKKKPARRHRKWRLGVIRTKSSKKKKTSKSVTITQIKQDCKDSLEYASNLANKSILVGNDDFKVTSLCSLPNGEFMDLPSKSSSDINWDSHLGKNPSLSSSAHEETKSLYSRSNLNINSQETINSNDNAELLGTNNNDLKITSVCKRENLKKFVFDNNCLALEKAQMFGKSFGFLPLKLKDVHLKNEKAEMSPKCIPNNNSVS